MNNSPIEEVDRQWAIWYDGLSDLTGLETWEDKDQAFQYFQEDLHAWLNGEMDPDTPRPRFVCVETMVHYAD